MTRALLDALLTLLVGAALLWGATVARPTLPPRPSVSSPLPSCPIWVCPAQYTWHL